MKLSEKNIKRLGIFFFYDKDGVVDDYVIYMLEDMVLNTSHNIVVCNGKLTEESRKRFETLPNTEILVRENKGFDVWAYKAALEYYGWDVIDTYDEIFMYNFTIMGPVGHFSTMFEEMNQRDLDFWGITIHNGAPFDPWGNMKEGKIPIHIQSHFIAVRKKMIQSEEFHKYWDERPMIKCYEDAVGLHEAIFTGIFEKVGYKWDVYVETEDLVEQTFYPLFNMPVDLIKNRKCPIFKRKLFINDFTGTIQENANLCARELFDYLKNETDYDTDMIMEHLLRSANLCDIVSGLNLNYILDDTPLEKKDNCQKSKCGIFVSTIGWNNHFYEYCQFLENVPNDVDVFLVVEEKNKNFEMRNFHISCIEKNAEQFELMMYFEEEIKAYDLVCFIDSYGEDAFPIYNILSAKEFLYREVLESKGYIERSISLFHNNKRLGMLVPNSPVHGGYYSMIEEEWKQNYNYIKNAIEKCKISVDIREEKKSPVAMGNCCWIRTNILEEYLRNHDSFLEDEDKEIVGGEKIWSYLLPLIAQSRGYYTASACPKQIGENLLNTFYKLAMDGNVYAMPASYYNVNAEIYYDLGEGFKVNEVVKIVYELNAFCEDKVEFKIKVPCNTKYIRFDPCEGFMCVCSDVKCDVKEINIHNINGIHFGTEDLFLTKDPQYIIEGDFSAIDEITLTMKNMSIFWNENGLEKEMNDIFSEKEELLKAVQYLLEEKKQLEDKTKEVIDELKTKNNQLENEIMVMKSSRSWRWTSWFRKRKE